MTELETSPNPVRDEVISQASAEARAQVAHNIVASTMYHHVIVGTGEQVRTAAGWIFNNGSVSRKIDFDDIDTLEQKKLDHLQQAKDDLDVAERVESWAGALFDTQDVPEIIALKTHVKALHVEGLDFKETKKQPKVMIAFEQKTEVKMNELESLKAVRRNISKVLNGGKGYEKLDIKQAVKQMKFTHGQPVTARDLALLQREIIATKIKNSQEELQRRTDITDALRTGMLSHNLKKLITSAQPDAFNPKEIQSLDEIKPLDPHEIIEGLGLDVRPYNCLKRAGIQTVRRLATMTKAQLATIPNLGLQGIDEIQNTLAQYGLSLAED